jgi:TRAP-type C4-dicarboxylate transport system permease small subunit
MKTILRCYDIGALISFCAMMGCILIEVVCRNILHLPTTWAEEASRLFCVWSVFLGSASAWFRKSHIVIDVLPRRLRGRSQLTLRLIIDLLSAIFLIAIWFGTLSIMKVSYPSKTTALEISISYFYLGVFFGLTGMTIFHLVQLKEAAGQWFHYQPQRGQRS